MFFLICFCYCLPNNKNEKPESSDDVSILQQEADSKTLKNEGGESLKILGMKAEDKIDLESLHHELLAELIHDLINEARKNMKVK
jgi:hypothetical protein